MSNADPVRAYLKHCRISGSRRVRLDDYDTAWNGGKAGTKADRKAAMEAQLRTGIAELAEAQARLYASDTWSLLVVIQALDAAGKDSLIKHVMSGVNPQGCQVYSFKQPSVEELEHDFLWRCNKALPERGRIGIFNRSYYEEVLVVRVHPEYLRAQRIPNAKVDDKFWEGRYEDINAFEKHLSRNGTRILKFFLNVSKRVQRKRFLERLSDSSKHWKFSLADLAERKYWKRYRAAFEECLTRTSTEWAPWHVIPADHKWATRALVARAIINELNSLDLKYPQPDKDELRKLEAARAQLKAR